MEAKANQDSTERKGKGEKQPEFGGCWLHVQSSRELTSRPCFFLDAPEGYVAQVCLSSPGVCASLVWRGCLRLVRVLSRVVCVFPLRGGFAFSTGGRTSGNVRVPGPK